MDLLHLVDRLEELVGSAQKMPIGSRAIVDRRRILDIVDQMRVAVPQEVRDAQEMVTQRDELYREAEEEARLILARAEERVELFSAAVADIPGVRVIANSGLTVDAAKEHGAHVLVKGLRALTDFHQEFDMALMNRKMAPEVESTFLMTSLDYLFVSASRIRELASFGYPVEDLVPPGVAEALKEKIKNR